MSSHTLLVLRALGLGDLLTALPALRGLRRKYPRHHLVLAAPDPLSGMLPLIPEIDELMPTGGLTEFEWRRRPPEVAVNLHGCGPQSVAAMCSTRARTILSHFHPAYPTVGGPAWFDGQHEVRRWCRMLHHWGIQAAEDDLLLPTPSATSFPDSVIVHPGASHGARRWPVERYAAVARRLAERGNQVLITGADTERAPAQRLAELAGLDPEAVLAGRTGLWQLACLVADAKLVVCGDTGIAHLATAYRTPSVVLFGPVAPKHWGPPTDARHIALWHGRSGNTFAAEPDPGLLALSTQQVIEAAEGLLVDVE